MREGSDDRDMEGTLRTIWAELLDLCPSEIGGQSNFMELGGNSMLVLNLQVAIANVFQLECSTDQLLETPTFADLLALIGRV